MWFHSLQPELTWFSSVTFYQFVFFVKLSSLVSSSILLILTHNSPAFCPLPLHSSPVYQITDLISLTLHQPHSLRLPPFIPSCDVPSLRLKLFLCLLARLWLILVHPELFPSSVSLWKCLGGFINACWGRGNSWCADPCHVNRTFTDGWGLMPAVFIDLKRIPHLYKMVVFT